MAKRTWRADTGHKGELLMEGIFRILSLFFSCKVLDHFTRTRAPGGAKMISALASCSRGLNLEIAWGTRLDMRRNEKKDNRKAAL